MHTKIFAAPLLLLYVREGRRGVCPLELGDWAQRQILQIPFRLDPHLITYYSVPLFLASLTFSAGLICHVMIDVFYTLLFFFYFYHLFLSVQQFALFRVDT